MNRKLFAAGAVGAALLVALGSASAGRVTDARLRNADREPGQWLSVGRTTDEQRYSPLTQINRDNVSRLGLAWYADFDTNRGQEASPLVIDGVLYTTTAWSKVLAFDAKTGKLLWRFDPQVAGSVGIKGCCDVVNRGLAAWDDKLYLGAYDGRLIALDARTGRKVWEVMTTDPAKSYTITGAPRIANGKVIIGNAGSEIGVRGYVSAYDARTGKLVWRFYTVPGDPSKPYEQPELREAAKTWNGDLYWQLGGGGTVWDGIAFDPGTNLVYFGTANGTPWVAESRSPGGGDNLFLVSIVAVDADTGRYAWHYQTAPAETWDFDATSPLTLADLDLPGGKRRVVMQESKNGFFYVLDARTGKLLSADPYTKVTWATHVDLATGRPVEVPEARFGRTGKPMVVQPGGQGGHAWQPTSFSPRTKLMYMPVAETSTAFAPNPDYVPREGVANTGMGRPPADIYEGLHDVPRTSRSFLVAWDPVARREVWRSENRGTISSGVLSTAGGLVFQGAHAGEFSAFDDTTGRKLWSMETQAGVVAGPVSYEVDGEQYVATLAGFGSRDYYTSNRSRLLVFKLGGAAQLPPVGELPPPRLLDPPPDFGTPGQLSRGEAAWQTNCVMCHETQYGNRGLFPNLLVTPLLHTAEGFRRVVIDGVLEPRGMASFRGRISAEDAEAIRAWLTRRANDQKAAEATAPRG